MKKLLILLCISILSVSCGTAQPAQMTAAPTPELTAESSEPESSAEIPQEEPSDEPPGEDEEGLPTTYEPEESMTPRQIVEAYFEQQYLAYINLAYIDLSSIIDMDRGVNINMMRWHEMLIQRRKLLLENDLCYVETEKFPYTIEFGEEPEDDRMELWTKWLADMDGEVVHFRIKGEEGKAYPPTMAVNSHQSMLFRKVDGEWKISMHYFPGSVRKFSRNAAITVPDEYDMLEQLTEEFASVHTTPDNPSIPQGATAYNAENAVEYAIRYTEEPNPAFYHITDWIGNCANFVSQSVWSGFSGETEYGWDGAYMTSQWYGGDGGSPAWENVNYFWSCITSGQELGGYRLGGAAELRNGDIIQIRSLQSEEEDRFTHMLMVVDEETMTLSQNSPDCFLYYSDVVNVEPRFVRPTYVIG